MAKLTEVDWGAKITIENICVACERKIKPCKEPCKQWYDFAFPNNSKIYTPSGEEFTAEQWKERYKRAKIPTVK